MNKNQKIEQLRKTVREVIQEELTTGQPSGDKETGIVTIPLMDKDGKVIGYVKRKGTDMVGRIGPRAPRAPQATGNVDEEENNFLPEPPDQLDDIPSVTLHIDDEGMMKIEVSAFFHDQGNGKVPLLIDNPVLQELVMKAIQVETQKAFRKAVHGVLGVPYGLPESSTVPEKSPTENIPSTKPPKKTPKKPKGSRENEARGIGQIEMFDESLIIRLRNTPTYKKLLLGSTE